MSDKQQITCPGCSKVLPSLDKLDFHLTYACPSRKDSKTSPKPKRTREIGREENVDPEQIVGDKSIECPGCQQKVLVEALDFHLEKSCLSRAIVTTVPRSLDETGDVQRKPPGLVVLPNFVNEDEERMLVSILEADDNWKLSIRNGRCDMKNWGLKIDYSAGKPRTRYPNPSENEKDLPDFLMFVIKRFEQYPPLSAWWPNEANANRYIKREKHFLTPHFDDRNLSGDIICNVSLLSDCIMTFQRPGSSGTPFRVRLPRFSASVMSRSARYDFTHAIANDDLLGEKRISLNFRQQTEPSGLERGLGSRFSNS